MRRKQSVLRRAALATLLLMAGSAAGAAAQVERNLPTQQLVFDTAMYGSMKWRNIGPTRGGRSIGVAGSTARPLEYYFGATGGGLWKTTDGGTTWNPVTDGQIGSATVGPVAVCEANPDVVYIGTGETQLRGNIQPGDGVYKSTDAGKSWQHIGLREAHNFARVRIHPTDCNLVYAAAFGHYGAPNPERGIYRSRDGGQNWERVLFRNDSTGGVDISIDPKNPDVIYAALWEAWRVPWGMSSGGPGSGLFKSTDGGTTWTELTRNPGLPQNQLIGKIGVSVSPVDPNRIYAIIEADSGGVFRSDDAGATWRRTNDERKLRQRAFYYTRINADTQEKDRVYVLNVGFWRSDDGGEKFDTQIRVPHGDNHDLWIAPNDNQRMVEANDGGGNVSVNGGRTWTEQDYSTAQIYRVATTSHQPYFVCGGQQDNTTVCTPSKGWSHLLARGGGNQQIFFAAGGCESGYVAPHPTNPDIFYAGCYGGSLDRFDRATGQERAINVWPENPMGQSAIDLKERVQWTFPIVFSPHDPNVLYTASQHLWKSTNEGQSWERISGDLTRADPKTMGPSGGPITRDQTGVETFATIFTVAPSPHDANVIWTGSDDGLVHITRDGGRSWQNVTPPGMPEYMKITTIDASPHRPGAAYMVGNRFLLDDFSPYVYRTEDYGQTWTKITDGIPADEFARSIREDTQRPGLLFLGTEEGVRVSWDNGRSWQPLSLNLPVVQVSDLTVKDNDLVISTHGRGFYVLDDITPLRQFTPQIVRARAHLYDPVDPVRGVDQGVTVTYRLQRPVRSLKIEFLDAQGQVIRTFTPEPDTARRGEATGTGEEEEEEFGPPRAPRHAPNRAGMNRFVWNLRYPGPTSFPGIIMWAADTAAGPKAPPGSYQVRLTVDGRSQTKSFQVRTDPRLTGLDAADLQAQFEMAMRIRNRVSEANEAVLLIRGIKEQIDERIQRANDPQLTAAGEALKARLSEVEEEIYQVRLQSNQDPLNYPIKLNNKLAALMGHIESADARPTDQSVQVFNELSGQLDRQLGRLNQVLDEELPLFNQHLSARRFPPVARTPLDVEGQRQTQRVRK